MSFLFKQIKRRTKKDIVDNWRKQGNTVDGSLRNLRFSPLESEMKMKMKNEWRSLCMFMLLI